jgi:hypothetical protein
MERAPGQVTLDFAHVGIKAHREHAVGFIIDDHFEMFEREGTFKQMIEHPSRRADDNVGTCFER